MGYGLRVMHYALCVMCYARWTFEIDGRERRLAPETWCGDKTDLATSKFQIFCIVKLWIEQSNHISIGPGEKQEGREPECQSDVEDWSSRWKNFSIAWRALWSCEVSECWMDATVLQRRYGLSIFVKSSLKQTYGYVRKFAKMRSRE
jgi:hypothetical protein